MSCLRKISCNSSSYLQTRSNYSRSLFSDITNNATEVKRQARALRVLNVISSKPGGAPNLQTHLRLIEDLLRTGSTQFRDHAYSDELGCSKSRKEIPDVFDEILLEDSSSSTNGDTQRQGWRFNASCLSSELSYCRTNRDLRTGLGFHCLAITTGFVSNVYVGSSLISLYSEFGDVENAYKVFDEMPEKNVVSWTAIISGYAQEWRVDICVQLYSKMRNSTSEPNDFTLTTLLSACTGSGALGQGRSAHCQAIQMGFVSYVHISNALISLYCKCGSLKDAFQVFDQMYNRDVVSWNSVIAGYAQHGLAEQAIELFEEMKREDGTKPDSITYLGVLSSCRHAGLVKEGRDYFNLMATHGVNPKLDHYSCLVDLLGRFGLLQEALELIENMPIAPNAVIWGSLLSSCRVHGDVWIGIRAAEERLMLEPDCAATHVQLANLYAGVGYWKEAATVRKQMKDKGLRTNPGCSWIEIKKDVFRFRAEDRTNRRVSEIVHVLDCLVDHMRGLFVSPDSPDAEADYTTTYF